MNFFPSSDVDSDSSSDDGGPSDSFLDHHRGSRAASIQASSRLTKLESMAEEDAEEAG